ncbi:diaminopimelate decarboxylase [Alicyclobacillus tolerans]|uniref:diaminopimelate decarboxylase n=1 Tax=Alicyclobacillus tolerans TaxID=90970 RepID=UPI001F02C625|nr:diaminopimelate decarboxylase [Alicyclobacillus tolerans]MCF8568266.1 diaminopimelate decarboxylase [Alicyclobacillus tolerans]
MRPLQGTMKVGSEGHLWVGGCDTTQLAQKYGTPLFVYDEAYLRERIREFHAAFKATGVSYEVAYAAKAFCTIAMCQLADQEGCALDVVSGGELYTALQAGVDPGRIHMHGNNKTRAELEYAVSSGVSVIVVDNFAEFALLNDVATTFRRQVDVLLRIAPGVEAHTHEYISTGQQDSKFGFDLESGQARRALEVVGDYDALRCRGLHSHIGSQIFDSQGFEAAISRLAELYAYGTSLGLVFDVLNVGGGFGIRYTEEDDPAPIASSIQGIVHKVKDSFAALSLEMPSIWIEPGRSVVGPAAVTLYTAGSQKAIPGVRNYVSIDGGMTDNPRLALYGAKYEAMLANRASDEAAEAWSIAGKCCESGDMVIWDAPLPRPQMGDVVAVFDTGAYNYSMASNYNRIPRPAVVFVRDGRSGIVVERETYEDVVRLDRPLSYDEENAAASSAMTAR